MSDPGRPSRMLRVRRARPCELVEFVQELVAIRLTHLAEPYGLTTAERVQEAARWSKV